jgi:hypothetical protein
MIHFCCSFSPDRIPLLFFYLDEFSHFLVIFMKNSSQRCKTTDGGQLAGLLIYLYGTDHCRRHYLNHRGLVLHLGMFWHSSDDDDDVCFDF